MERGLRPRDRNVYRPGFLYDASPLLERIIPPRYAGANLADLPESLVQRFHALPDEKGLLLWGKPGVGKTHAMVAFMRALWTDGCEIVRVTYDDICLQIRETYRAHSLHHEAYIVGKLTGIDKLVIEDVGLATSLGQRESDFSVRVLVTLLDKRLEACRATYITSNKTVEELGESFDQRVASRLCQACHVIELEGADRRMAGRT